MLVPYFLITDLRRSRPLPQCLARSTGAILPPAAPSCCKESSVYSISAFIGSLVALQLIFNLFFYPSLCMTEIVSWDGTTQPGAAKPGTILKEATERDVFVKYNLFFCHGSLADTIYLFTCRFLRSVAYRQFTRLLWDYLGSSKRYPLPCCAYSEIRKQFPSEDGSYHGFEDENTHG